MKKIIILFVYFLMLSLNAFAQSNCTTNAAGDVTCADAKYPNVAYTTPSASTLAAEAKAAVARDAQDKAAQLQRALNDQALQKLIADRIASDPTLSAQQAAITKS